MNILFVHQALLGQFLHLAPALAAAGHRVVALCHTYQADASEGVEIVRYEMPVAEPAGAHPWVEDFERKVIRAKACAKAAGKLNGSGFYPAVIIAHYSWGDSLFLKDIWPAAKMGIYCEFFCWRPVGFDPEFKDDEPGLIKLRSPIDLMHFLLADAAISPTRWQADTYPGYFRGKISVIHEGVDTNVLRPNAAAAVTINGKITLAKGDEVITFVSRMLEPHRGFHIFMRALPEILRRRTTARVIIVGADMRGYGPTPADGQGWKSVFVNEVRPQISDADWSRVHFVGHLPRPAFVTLLQVSAVHVYLTYPTVLSWSLLEAMSAGCAIVGSDTEPVREVMRHDETGRLVDFFDVNGLAGEVCALLDDPGARARLGKNAREFVRGNYDLRTICLPQQLEWVSRLAGS